MIYADSPTDWRDLEDRVRRIFQEIGCAALQGRRVGLVRGAAEVDVVVHDRTRRPHSLIFCECKHWARPVPKSIIHAFRTVVQDGGANLGFIISNAGFQSGALAAAKKANIRLVTWEGFQAEMYDRWIAAKAAELGDVSDDLYRLAYPEAERHSHSLIDHAIKVGGSAAWDEYETLRDRYPKFYLTSPAAGGDPTQEIPQVAGGRSWNGHFWDYLDSPRDYFDRLIALAPQIYAEFAAFILKHCKGHLGSDTPFDRRRLRRLVVGQTTADEAQAILKYRYRAVYAQPGPLEKWSFQGSVTRFKPARAAPKHRPGKLLAETRGRSLEVSFDEDKRLSDIALRESRSPGHP